jgi:anti-sigma factor RsiW
MNHFSHLSDDELERCLMGKTHDEAELARVEEHLIVCPACAERAEAMGDYIKAMKESLRRLQGDDAVKPQ